MDIVQIDHTTGTWLYLYVRNVYMYVCMYVCVYVYTYVECMCVYIIRREKTNKIQQLDVYY